MVMKEVAARATGSGKQVSKKCKFIHSHLMPPEKPLEWAGSSKPDLPGFPEEA